MIKLQKKSLRAIFGLPHWAHTAPLFLRFHETHINDRMVQKLAFLVWMSQNNCCGQLLNSMFSSRLTDGRTTRGCSSSTLVLPSARRLSGLNRPAFHGAVIWNSLSAAARKSANKQLFFDLLPSPMPVS